MSEEIIHLVEHLSQHKSIQELYEFTKELYDYVISKNVTKNLF